MSFTLMWRCTVCIHSTVNSTRNTPDVMWHYLDKRVHFFWNGCTSKTNAKKTKWNAFLCHLDRCGFQTRVSLTADGEVQQTFGVHSCRENTRPPSRETEDRSSLIQWVKTTAQSDVKHLHVSDECSRAESHYQPGTAVLVDNSDNTDIFQI